MLNPPAWEIESCDATRDELEAMGSGTADAIRGLDESKWARTGALSLPDLSIVSTAVAPQMRSTRMPKMSQATVAMPTSPTVISWSLSTRCMLPRATLCMTSCTIEARRSFSMPGREAEAVSVAIVPLSMLAASPTSITLLGAGVGAGAPLPRESKAAMLPSMSSGPPTELLMNASPGSSNSSSVALDRRATLSDPCTRLWSVTTVAQVSADAETLMRANKLSAMK
mmetsp:Transcript_25478/g.58751  ORF Transcript_25478/g.58751 Transcript_25478/m.58751 type:complete len:226 (+) Transcript_25478:624-1301(+)